jgi:hypothetical protein
MASGIVNQQLTNKPMNIESFKKEGEESIDKMFQVGNMRFSGLANGKLTPEELKAWHNSRIDKVLEEIEKHNNVIRQRLEYCLEQNGLDSCKNCGLDENDIITLNSRNGDKEIG